MTQQTVNDRLKKLIFYLDLNATEFSKALGYKSAEKISRLTRDKSKKSKPGFDILFDISKKFDFINIEWFITGEGSMLKNKTGYEEKIIHEEVKNNNPESKHIEDLRYSIELQKIIIDFLKNENHDLKKKLSEII